MAVRPILQLGNPLLWRVSEPVTDISSLDLPALINDLQNTLADFRSRFGFGRGVAAPQIGILKRVIYVRIHPEGFTGPLINPRIVWHSESTIELWDDCFSFPGLLVKVSRAATIRVMYEDPAGTSCSIDAKGELSELLQHEIDHLDGILATDRALSPRSFMMRTEREIARPGQ
ncbi:MAG: peptide deformylase [Candidatus Zixiibacteriota bacterium]